MNISQRLWDIWDATGPFRSRFRRQRIGLVCMRRDEMLLVHPDQISLNCSRCQAVVGVYPSGQNIIRLYGKRVEIICSHCDTTQPGTPRLLAPGAEIEPFQSQRRDHE